MAPLDEAWVGRESFSSVLASGRLAIEQAVGIVGVPFGVEHCQASAMRYVVGRSSYLIHLYDSQPAGGQIPKPLPANQVRTQECHKALFSANSSRAGGATP